MRFFLLFFCIITSEYLLSQSQIKMHYFSGKISIDGIIDSIWTSADSTNDFIQMEPTWGNPPKYKTTAKILSNSESLFCLFICEIPLDKLQVEQRPRDDASGDRVNLFLDTFSDKTTCYKFDVNAAGQIADAIIIDDGRYRDYSWDGVWYGASKIYSFGYVVELEIPFKSIRYSKDINEWGIEFQRWTASEVEDLSWSRYKREEGVRISKFNTLKNINPGASGLALEIYPVGMLRIEKETGKDTKVKPDAGLDIKWNPDPGVGIQLTMNPDFAQIEADPFQVNLSKYELYFNERRPFFVEGNEIFKSAGKESNSGFYKPLEFFYSRRIGKKMIDGSEIPILGGLKFFGKQDGLDYGALVAYTGNKDIIFDNEKYNELNSTFAVVRMKKRIFENSSIGFLYASKFSSDNNNSALALDGAYRTGQLQWAYQIGKSFNGDNNGYAFSTGLKYSTKTLFLAFRTRWIESNFNVDELGFVPWKGNGELVTFIGPVWMFDTGIITSILLAGGAVLNYDKVDGYTDYYPALIINFSFRAGWGFEFDIITGKAKEKGEEFITGQHSFNMWANWSKNYNFNLNANLYYDYNYNRDYFAWMTNFYFGGSYTLYPNLSLEADFNSWIEFKPDKSIEDITYNFRPKIMYAINKDIHFRLFVDNTILKSTGKLEQMLIGGLFSYNFSPKSWIYFAYNDTFENIDYIEYPGKKIKKFESLNKIIVFKIRYLYYF